MRIVSLVPSWTETLLLAEGNVVGRTRYCVHPQELIAKIPIVGGTKVVDWKAVADLAPDLVVLDQEENPQAFAKLCPGDWIASHVNSLPSARAGTKALWEVTQLKKLQDEVARWDRILTAGPRTIPLAELPGIESWLRRPTGAPQKLHYIIWQNPWMAIARQTFIGSVLTQLGWGDHLPTTAIPYPELKETALNDPEAVCLFATEPFPFSAAKVAALHLNAGGIGIINGESYAWFGSRALRFLEKMA